MASSSPPSPVRFSSGPSRIPSERPPGADPSSAIPLVNGDPEERPSSRDGRSRSSGRLRFSSPPGSSRARPRLAKLIHQLQLTNLRLRRCRRLTLGFPDLDRLACPVRQQRAYHLVDQRHLHPRPISSVLFYRCENGGKVKLTGDISNVLPSWEPGPKANCRARLPSRSYERLQKHQPAHPEQGVGVLGPTDRPRRYRHFRHRGWR